MGRIITEFKPYFNVKETSPEVIARAYQEEAVGRDIEYRTVEAEVYAKKRIERDKWEYNGHAKAERKATINTFDLMSDGYEMVIWLSPKSEIYEEGRMTIMIKTEVDGREGFDPWGIPLLVSEEKTMELGERLLEKGGVSMDGINGLESLRENPIAFSLEEKGEWMEKCRELMPEYGELWDFIAEGKVRENWSNILKVVEEEMVVARGNNVLFEMGMLARGRRLNIAGGHGGSWLSQLGVGVGLMDIFNNVNIIGKGDERLAYCEGCGKYYMRKKGKCPLCGSESQKGSESRGGHRVWLN